MVGIPLGPLEYKIDGDSSDAQRAVDQLIDKQKELGKATKEASDSSHQGAEGFQSDSETQLLALNKLALGWGAVAAAIGTAIALTDRYNATVERTAALTAQLNRGAATLGTGVGETQALNVLLESHGTDISALYGATIPIGGLQSQLAREPDDETALRQVAQLGEYGFDVGLISEGGLAGVENFLLTLATLDSTQVQDIIENNVLSEGDVAELLPVARGYAQGETVSYVQQQLGDTVLTEDILERAQDAELARRIREERQAARKRREAGIQGGGTVVDRIPFVNDAVSTTEDYLDSPIGRVDAAFSNYVGRKTVGVLETNLRRGVAAGAAVVDAGDAVADFTVDASVGAYNAVRGFFGFGGGGSDSGSDNEQPVSLNVDGQELRAVYEQSRNTGYRATP